VRGFPTRQILLLLVLAFVPAIGEALYFRGRVSWQSPVPSSERVTVEQAKSWGSRVQWIDARPDREFAHEHFHSALSLNEDRWNEQLPNILAAWSPEKLIVVYCSAEGCGASRAVAERLRNEAQLKNVFVLDGGWEALRAAER
jgi:rhodanese-related sulfurtransferase